MRLAKKMGFRRGGLAQITEGRVGLPDARQQRTFRCTGHGNEPRGPLILGRRLGKTAPARSRFRDTIAR